MTTEQAPITPYTLRIDDAEVEELRRRVRATRWPDERPEAGWSDGMPLAIGRELAEHWADGFDWRAQEERINAHPQFTTEIDGHDQHFFHVRSPREDARPLLLIHGWPTGPTDFLAMIPLLTEPEDGSPAFHVIAPTIPGFGIGGPVSDWTLTRVAEAFAELMTRLGYERFLVHGYDTGAGVARDLGLLCPDRVAGIHTTGLLGGEELTEETADMSDPDEAAAVAKGYAYQYEVGGYAILQSTRPQSLAYALTDSPVGQLSWTIERLHDWSTATPDDTVPFDRDEVLTLVSLTWFFRTTGSSARYYKYGLPGWDQPLEPSTVPTAVLVMPDDLGRPIRRLAEQTDRIVRWTSAPTGGHFAAWEQPRLVADDIRAGVGHLD